LKRGLIFAAMAGVLVTAACPATAKDIAAAMSARQIRADLAKRFHCRWRMMNDQNFHEHFGRCSAGTGAGLDLVLSADDHDRFSYLEYRLVTQVAIKGPRDRQELSADRAGADWLLDYFLPRWPERHRWLARVLANTRHIDDHHQRKIGRMGVAVKDDSPADRDETVVLLGIADGDPSQWAPTR
jgi:hypothetical protein